MFKLCFKSSVVVNCQYYFLFNFKRRNFILKHHLKATAVSLTVWDKMFYFSAVDGLRLACFITNSI